MAIEILIESQIQPFDNVAEFPATGAEKTIYIAKDINAAYYWNGSAYILIVDPTEVVWGDITGNLLNQLDLIDALDLKVDKEAGKGLSQEDYTTAEKSKLAGIEAGAEVNVNADWNATGGDAEILNKPDLTAYATDAELAAGLATKENTITAGTTAQYFRGDKTFQTLDKGVVGLGNVDNTSDANKPISTATQTALNAKQDLLGFTPENVANKSTSVVTDQASNTKYPSVKALYDWAVGLFATIAQLATKQDTLVSGTNIKTINGSSILGSGNFLTIPQLTTAQRDALTPVAGYPIYNTTEGYLETYDNFWGWMPVASQNEWRRKWGWEYWNDLGVQSGNLQDGVIYGLATNSGSQGVATGTFPSAANYFGFLGLRTGILPNGGYQLRSDGTAGRTKIQGFGKYVFETRIFIRALSTATDRYAISAGDTAQTNTTISNGMVFVYDEGGVGTGTIASPNWQIVTAYGGVRSVFVTSVVVAINTWYKFRLEVNENSTEVKYYIDDILVRTETTNVPIQGSGFIQTNIAINKSTGTTEVAMLIDYVGMKKKFTTPR